MRSKSMSTSPLCSEMVDFYKPLRKIRYKISLIRATPHESCIFSGQNACGCRHSAVICSISIPSPVKYGTKLASSLKSMHFRWSKLMSRTPLCSNLLNFYTVSSKIRYKVGFLFQIHAFLRVKVDVKDPTLQQCAQFLYRLQ